MFFQRSVAPVDHDDAVLQMPFFHRVLGDPLDREFPDSETAFLALGCFWGAEKLYWQLDGVLSTAAGYMGGTTRSPRYEETCTGLTGHAETVRIVFDPSVITYADLLKLFFENHDPTQGDRQGNDVGSQYRSAIFTTTDEQAAVAARVRDEFQAKLSSAGYGKITTTVEPAPQWWYAEPVHQQYLDANPGGYCPVHATGITCG